MSQQTIYDIHTKQVIAVLMLGESIGVRMQEIIEKARLPQRNVEMILAQLMECDVVVTKQVKMATGGTTEDLYKLRDISEIAICCN